MPLLTDLANAIRRDNPQDLFCLVEFGNHGYILVSSSGKGYPPKGPNINTVLSHDHSRRIVFIEDDKSGDGEERFFKHFDHWYAKYGNKTTYVTIITATSPCNRVCSTMIRNVAMEYKKVIESWVVLFHDYYHPDVQSGSIGEAVGKLNNESNPWMYGGLLHIDFVDMDTLHHKGVKKY